MKLVTEQGYSAAHAARELNMPFNTLCLWLKKAGWKKEQTSQTPLSDALSDALSDDPAALKVRMRELEAQVRRLEMEKEILKKATAYFASQSH
jgi:transposase